MSPVIENDRKFILFPTKAWSWRIGFLGSLRKSPNLSSNLLTKFSCGEILLRKFFLKFLW